MSEGPSSASRHVRSEKRVAVTPPWGITSLTLTFGPLVHMAGQPPDIRDAEHIYFKLLLHFLSWNGFEETVLAVAGIVDQGVDHFETGDPAAMDSLMLASS